MSEAVNGEDYVLPPLCFFGHANMVCNNSTRRCMWGARATQRVTLWFLYCVRSLALLARSWGVRAAALRAGNQQGKQPCLAGAA